MTDITFGDKMGSKVIPLNHSHTKKITLSWCMFVSWYYIFLFETVLIIHMAYKVFQEYIFSLSVHLFVCKSFRSSVCSSICQLLDESFALDIFIAYISVTTLQICSIFKL